MEKENEARVLVLAPTGRDAAAIMEVIHRANIAAQRCDDIEDLIEKLGEGAGAALIAEEALGSGGANRLRTWIEMQPAWSDFPFLVLSSRKDETVLRSWRQALISLLRNVTLLERPLQVVTIVSMLTFALRSRQRQYEVRGHLERREKEAASLEQIVQARTDELRCAYKLLQEQMAERERIADQLRHAQRMEAIGQLTGGIAHDFNNLLMAISGGLEILERRPERRMEIVDAIKKATARGAGLTHQLLAFSRRQALRPETIDLKTYFSQLVDLLDRSLRGDVEVVTEIAPDIWAVEADPGELQLVILNLAVNARDAMPNGGHITIKAFNKKAAHGEEPRDFVCISVTDEGTGIKPEILGKVFEPFFTTKEIGKGSGLGLAQVHGYVAQSGGKVEISSVVGQGTTVSLYLPRSEEAPAIRSAVRGLPARKDHAKGRVLLVEDDEEVAALVTQMILELEYCVTRAPTASAALDILASQKIDIVFSDVMMPGDIDGVQLSREIKRLYPHIPVLLTSGYAEVIRRTSGSDVHILAKPYQLDDLAAAFELVRGEQSFMPADRGTEAAQGLRM